MSKNVNYKELQEAVGKMNEACGTTIKIIGAKKDDLVKAFKTGAEEFKDTLPPVVKAFYEKEFGVVDDNSTPIDSLRPHAEVTGIMVTDDSSYEEIEEAILDVIAGYNDDQWDALPEKTQKWNNDILTERENAEKGEAKTEVKEGEKADKQEKVKTQKEVDKEVKAAKKKAASAKKHDPRPGFRYNPGTSAALVIDTFEEVSGKEGIKMADLIVACQENAKIKTTNMKSRVASAINYAKRPEGGTQVVSIGGRLYTPENAPVAKV